MNKEINAAILAQNWTPQKGDTYFFIDKTGEIFNRSWSGFDSTEKELLEFGNCFRTGEEADAALERVRAALKMI